MDVESSFDSIEPNRLDSIETNEVESNLKETNEMVMQSD